MARTTIFTAEYTAPCGTLVLGSFADSLCLCDWLERKNRDAVDGRLCRFLDAGMSEGSTAIIDKAAAQLDEYFAGLRQSFDIALMPLGTDFQKRVWEALLSVPCGSTASYKEIALQAGAPAAVRAVANAVGANPLSIFVPCHRIIGSDNALTGYAGGIAAKKYLLNFENALSDDLSAHFSYCPCI